MLKLDRRTLAQLLQNNQQAIVTFERILNDVGEALPSTIEEANALAGSALAMAQAALAMVAVLAEALARLEGAPAPPPPVDHDDTAPRAHLGTISSQNADQVEITGGTAALASLTVAGQITSTAPPGAPPFVVASSDKVANLYVDRAANADTAASLGVAYAYPSNATDLASCIALANALKAANTAKGV